MDTDCVPVICKGCASPIGYDNNYCEKCGEHLVAVIDELKDKNAALEKKLVVAREIIFEILALPGHGRICGCMENIQHSGYCLNSRARAFLAEIKAAAKGE